MHYIALRRNTSVPEAAALTLDSPEIGFSEFLIIRIAAEFRRCKGLTIRQVASMFEIPPPVATRMLTLLESGGLVYESSGWRAGSGNPLRVYHASPTLRKWVPKNSHGVGVGSGFETLRKMCIFKVDGCCSSTQGHLPCAVSTCPLLRFNGGSSLRQGRLESA